MDKRNKRKVIGARMQDGFGPPGTGHQRNPTASELRWCTWGFLLAAQWYRNGLLENPTSEYLEARADMDGLPMPTMDNGEGK